MSDTVVQEDYRSRARPHLIGANISQLVYDIYTWCKLWVVEIVLRKRYKGKEKAVDGKAFGVQTS